MVQTPGTITTAIAAVVTYLHDVACRTAGSRDPAELDIIVIATATAFMIVISIIIIIIIVIIIVLQTRVISDV